MDVKTLSEVIANQGFPIALSILQNREYYSLRFGKVQKELSGMKVELGKIE